MKHKVAKVYIARLKELFKKVTLSFLLILFVSIPFLLNFINIYIKISNEFILR